MARQANSILRMVPKKVKIFEIGSLEKYALGGGGGVAHGIHSVKLMVFEDRTFTLGFLDGGKADQRVVLHDHHVVEDLSFLGNRRKRCPLCPQYDCSNQSLIRQDLAGP